MQYDFIPTMSGLLSWQSDLQNTSVAIGKFYCEFRLAEEQCRYDLEAILIAQNLQKTREIKQAPAGNYMFKVNSRNTRTRCEICSKLTGNTPELRQRRRSWCLYC